MYTLCITLPWPENAIINDVIEVRFQNSTKSIIRIIHWLTSRNICTYKFNLTFMLWTLSTYVWLYVSEIMMNCYDSYAWGYAYLSRWRYYPYIRDTHPFNTISEAESAWLIHQRIYMFWISTLSHPHINSSLLCTILVFWFITWIIKSYIFV